MSRENVELVRKSFRAYNAGGIEDLLPFIASDARWHAAAEWVEESSTAVMTASAG